MPLCDHWSTGGVALVNLSKVSMEPGTTSKAISGPVMTMPNPHAFAICAIREKLGFVPLLSMVDK